MGETPVIRPLRIFGISALAIGLMSIMTVFVKLAAEEHSIVEIMFFRNALAVIPVLMLIQAHREGFALLRTKHPLGHLLRGAVGITSMSFVFWSYALLPLADATALQFAMPIMLTALSVPLLNERVGKWRWGAVLVGFAGVLVIAAPAGVANWMGIGVALMGAFLTSCTMIIIRKLGRTEHALTIVFYFSLFGAILSGIVLPWYWTPPTFESFIYLVMTGICGGAGQVFLTKAYAEAPAAYVSPFSYLGIIYATFFGWLIWAEIPETHVLVGAAIVIASGLFILYRETVLKRDVVQSSILEPAPTEADEYGPMEGSASDPDQTTGQKAAENDI